MARDQGGGPPPKVTYPLNYAANFGTYLVWDPATGRGGDGAIPVYPITQRTWLKTASFRDGMSNTIGFAEVKAYQPYARNTSSPAAVGAAYPADVAEVAGMAATGTYRGEIAHTEWTDSPSHQTGFSFVFTPNTKVLYTPSGAAGPVDVDVLTQVEGSHASKPSYSIVTSRSYHTGGVVNVLLMDGSVRAVAPSVNLAAWRAYGTRDGGEVATLD